MRKLSVVTEHLTVLQLYEDALSVNTRTHFLEYFNEIVDYYVRVEGLSKQEAGNLASNILTCIAAWK